MVWSRAPPLTNCPKSWQPTNHAYYMPECWAILRRQWSHSNPMYHCTSKYIKTYADFSLAADTPRNSALCCSLCGELGHRQDMSAPIPTWLCALCATRRTLQPDMTAAPSANFVDWTTPRPARTAEKSSVLHLCRCGSGNEP
ncbi:hypothetical protein HPB48_026783 [Haemaphysalis longicornis]|uniref:Uncharacterized protein n=1 Tax=Haemaphysalis longicornis TaxID=44386 RepID=A0A9J6HCE3_HAELO|nr:hypothetical protein HPB48_026783 [Haemaphysalis longicornis]